MSLYDEPGPGQSIEIAADLQDQYGNCAIVAARASLQLAMRKGQPEQVLVFEEVVAILESSKRIVLDWLFPTNTETNAPR